MTLSSEMQQLREHDRLHHFHAQTNPVQHTKQGPTMLTQGTGVHLRTDEGHEVIDGMSGAWCANIGYGNTRVCDAAYAAMKQLSFGLTFGGRTNPWAAALSHKLAEITPAQFQHFFFASSGSEATETALKMAWYYWRLRDRPGKRIIIARDLGYHGNTLFATHLVGGDGWTSQYGLPFTDLVHRIETPYWYRFGQGRTREAFARDAAAALERKILEVGPENVAAFIGEPVQATLGLIVPPPGYWQEIQRICERYEVLLVADEVVTGMGKTGRLFGFQAYDFEPDLFTMAKGFSSGYFPISCVAIGSKMSAVFQNTDRKFVHGFTNCGHPVGAAVALENIAVIEEEKLVDKVRLETAPYLAQRLQELMDFPCVGEVTGIGIIGAIEIDLNKMKPASLDDNVALAARIGDIAWRRGFHTRPVGTTLGMMLPLIVTREQIDRSIAILKDSFTEALA